MEFLSIDFDHINSQSVLELKSLVNRNWRSIRCEDLYKILDTIQQKEQVNKERAELWANSQTMRLAEIMTRKQLGDTSSKHEFWNKLWDNAEKIKNYNARCRT